MRELWAEANKSVQKSAIALRQMGFGNTVSTLSDEEACVAKMQAEFEKWLRGVHAWSCKFDADLNTIIDDYFESRPPFGAGRKKSEFPDAIVISMLSAWCKTTKQSVYIVSEDGDLRACCSSDGPFIHAASVKEVVSHGTASVKVHDAVSKAIRESIGSPAKSKSAPPISRLGSTGYRRGAMAEVEVESVNLDDLSIDEVVVMNFDGTNMTCAVYLTVELSVRVHVEREPARHSEDDWDLGYRRSHSTWIPVSADLTATVEASITEDGAVALADIQIDEQRIEVPWQNVERAID